MVFSSLLKFILGPPLRALWEVSIQPQIYHPAECIGLKIGLERLASGKICRSNHVVSKLIVENLITQISRSAVVSASDCLQNDLVTSRAILVECKMYADADISRGHLPAASR